MKPLARLLIVIAATIFAANPVLACCADGIGNHSSKTSQATQLAAPCHDVSERDVDSGGTAEQSPSVISLGHLDCGGCADCSEFAASPDASKAFASTKFSAHDEIAVAAKLGWRPQSSPQIVRGTRPPPRPGATWRTPITSKDQIRA